MDDKQVDVAIIEASALLATLIFLILSFYGSMYSQLLVYYLQQCAVSQQQCTSLAPVVTPFSTIMANLTPFAYYIGFFFVAAASVATIHLFATGRAWVLAGLQIMEFAFFLFGLYSLALMFFFNAPRDASGGALLAVIALGVIVLSLVIAYRRGQWRSEEHLRI